MQNPLIKIDAYCDVPRQLSNNVSSILLVQSIANYYKHQEAWEMWPTNPTGEVSTNVGIIKETEFPCYVAATQLRDENEVENLKNLFTIISTWREYTFSKDT